MSKVIDSGKPLSEEDRRYLVERGRGEEIARIDGIHSPATDEVPYEDWTVEELRAELSDRKLSTSGKKDDLVGRLYAADADQ